MSTFKTPLSGARAPSNSTDTEMVECDDEETAKLREKVRRLEQLLRDAKEESSKPKPLQTRPLGTEQRAPPIRCGEGYRVKVPKGMHVPGFFGTDETYILTKKKWNKSTKVWEGVVRKSGSSEQGKTIPLEYLHSLPVESASSVVIKESEKMTFCFEARSREEALLKFSQSLEGQEESVKERRKSLRVLLNSNTYSAAIVNSTNSTNPKKKK